jgi:integrase
MNKQSKRMVKDTDGIHRRGPVWYYKLKINGKWKEISAHTKSYQEARAKRQEALEAQKKGRLPNDKGKLVFERASEAWLAARQSHFLAKAIAENTLRTETERMQPLLARFAGRKLNRFTNDDIKAYQIARAAEVGAGTNNQETKLLRRILKDAGCWAQLAGDYKPLPENRRGPGIALTVDQECKLFETARTNPGWEIAYCAALLAANTTMRSCEVKGLRLGDIDLFSPKIAVQRKSTKSNAGHREIPLNDVALWAVRRLWDRAAVLGASDPTHYLLPAFLCGRNKKRASAGSMGFDVARPMKTWRTAWLSLRKAAGLPTLRFHDLRHSTITKLAEDSTTSDQTLMAISGHMSVEMIQYYAHIRSKAKENALARIKSWEPPEMRAKKETTTGPVS